LTLIYSCDELWKEVDMRMKYWFSRDIVDNCMIEEGDFVDLVGFDGE